MTTRVEKSPFSLYDFMGYIIPGLLFMVFMSLVYMAIGKESHMYTFLYRCLHSTFISQSKTSVVFDIGVIGFLSFFALSAFYVMGHFIATLSHISIDRVIVFSLLKYPILNTLDLIDDEDRDFPIMFWNLILVLLIISILILLTLHYIFFVPSLIVLSRKLLTAVLIIALLRVILPVISRLFSAEDKNMSMSPTRGVFLVHKWIYKILEKLTIDPLKKALFLNKKFDSCFQDKVLASFVSKFGLEPSKSKTNTYWLMHYYVLSHSSKMEAYQTNWLRLYGLCRNVSFACLLVVLCQLLLINKYSGIFSNAPGPQINIVCIALSTVFLIRYLVLYYNYYTKNLIRSFYMLTNVEITGAECVTPVSDPGVYI